MLTVWAHFGVGETMAIAPVRWRGKSREAGWHWGQETKTGREEVGGTLWGTQTISKMGGPHGGGDTESCSLLRWKAGGWGGREDTAWR